MAGVRRRGRATSWRRTGSAAAAAATSTALLSPRELRGARAWPPRGTTTTRSPPALPQRPHGRAAPAERLRQARTSSGRRPATAAVARGTRAGPSWRVGRRLTGPLRTCPRSGSDGEWRSARMPTAAPLLRSSPRQARRHTMSITTTPEDTALKAKHRAMWALGDYPAVATEVIAELGEVLVDAVGITAGRAGRRRRGRVRQRRDPRRPPRRGRRRDRPHARAARGGPPAAAAEGLTLRLGDRRRRGDALRRRPSSTSRSPASASCSPRTTSWPPTSWCASYARAAGSGCSAGRRRASSARCSPP